MEIFTRYGTQKCLSLNHCSYGPVVTVVHHSQLASCHSITNAVVLMSHSS